MGISLKLMYNIMMPSIIAIYKFLWSYGGFIVRGLIDGAPCLHQKTLQFG